MDHRSNSQEDDEQNTSETNEQRSDISPVPESEPEAPPIDVDDREGHEYSSETIELPGHDDTDGEIADKIDVHMPLPTDEAYHDDDRAEPDPYDIGDTADLHLPPPIGNPADEVDDFSTGEELDVDTAPAGSYHDRLDQRPDEQSESPDGDDRVRYLDEDGAPDDTGTQIYIGGPSDDNPVTRESGFSAASNEPDDAENVEEPQAAGINAALTDEEPVPPPLGDGGTTLCPVCGRDTDALRFCGHCGAQLTEARARLTSPTFVGRLQERAGHLLDPIAQWTRPGMVRFIMAFGGLLVLMALLANNGGLALIIGSAILPLVLIYWCLRSDVFDHEPPLVIAGFGLAGTIVGALLGWLGSLIVSSSWFDSGILNYGAAGYGGQFAELAGTAPFLVWVLVGIVFPLLALAAIIGLPIAMRQTFSLHNEVMDGLTIGAVMGGGYAFGTAIVFAAPMLNQGGPAADASAWTLTTIGIAVIRPLVWTLSAAILGAGAWRYLLSGKIGSVIIPIVIGTAAPLLFTLISIQLAPSGLWAEVLWGGLVAIVVGVFYMRAMRQAILQDRKILGQDNARVVCPNCHRVTPAGQFCAHCGEDISAVA